MRNKSLMCGCDAGRAQGAFLIGCCGCTSGRKRDTIARSDNAIITVTTRANVAIDVSEYALIRFYEFIVCCLLRHFDEKQVSKGFGSRIADGRSRRDGRQTTIKRVTSASVWTRHHIYNDDNKTGKMRRTEIEAEDQNNPVKLGLKTLLLHPSVFQSTIRRWQQCESVNESCHTRGAKRAVFVLPREQRAGRAWYAPRIFTAHLQYLRAT
jgi:hypothetical protein